MNKNKIFLVHDYKTYTYNELFQEVISRKEKKTLLKVSDENPFEIFVSLLHSMVFDYAIEVKDFNVIEDKESCEDANKEAVKNLDQDQIENVEELFKTILESKNWRINLYTSGTTGKPKKIEHTMEKISRNVRIGEKYMNNVWGFAYNPTHIAGIQVFLQAIANYNTIVYLFKVKRSYQEIFEEWSITHISATSTFYRRLLSSLAEKHFNDVIRITFGGEKINKEVSQCLLKIFPNAKINNIYALTEAGTIFSSRDEKFVIDDKMRKFIDVNEDDELLISKELVGESADLKFEGDWYNTHDVIEFVDERTFIFKSRRNDIVNVGGYNVNLLEIEDCILSFDIQGINDLKVYSKTNSVIGNVIIVAIEAKGGSDAERIKKELRSKCKEALQDWQVPRIIEFVNEINMTRTGKKART